MSNIVVVVVFLVGGGRMDIKTEIFIIVNSITNVDNFPKICQSICRFFQKLFFIANAKGYY